MFGLFRRSPKEPEPVPKRKVSGKSLRIPLSWEDRFAAIPATEAVEGNDESDWTRWDDTVAAGKRVDEEERRRNRN